MGFLGDDASGNPTLADLHTPVQYDLARAQTLAAKLVSDIDLATRTDLGCLLFRTRTLCDRLLAMTPAAASDSSGIASLAMLQHDQQAAPDRRMDMLHTIDLLVTIAEQSRVVHGNYGAAAAAIELLKMDVAPVLNRASFKPSLEIWHDGDLIAAVKSPPLPLRLRTERTIA